MTDLAADPEPALAHAYREMMTAVDAYRAVRQALRIENGVLRIGNRFVPVDRYREIAFVALGNASASLALGAWEGLGERLTQGIVAGPSAPPDSVPFRSWELPTGPPGLPAGIITGRAVEEIAGELGPRDLLLLLLSPGALNALALPPPGLTGPEWGELLLGLSRDGSSGAEVAEAARVLGRGPAGGRLPGLCRAGAVETLLIDRGDGPALVGGGPTVPLTAAEIARVAARFANGAGALPGAARTALDTARPGPSARPAGTHRPVVLLGPGDALAGASAALSDRRYRCRLSGLTLSDPPEEAAGKLLDGTEAILAADPAYRSGRGGGGADRPVGCAIFAGLTLGLLEGQPEGGAVDRFLSAAARLGTRRGLTVAVLPTAGSP
ncbi:MAG: DUF4147 domain-containing protein, partial [Thermoplasmata archaeon]